VDDGLQVDAESTSVTKDVDENIRDYIEGLDEEVAEVLPPNTGLSPTHHERSPFNFHFRFGDRGDGDAIDMNNFFPSFMHEAGRRPGIFRSNGRWWQGENVCVTEEEVEEEERTEGAGGSIFRMFNMETTSCSESPGIYKCTTRIQRRGISRTVTKEYRCCHGAVMLEGQCTAGSFTNMSTTLAEIENAAFLTSLRNYGFTEEKLDAENLTVFVPQKDALEDYLTDMLQEDNTDMTTNEVYRRRRRSFQDVDMKELLAAHVVEGIQSSYALSDEQILQCKWSDSVVRINTYRGASSSAPITTANCARITGSELPTTQGVVYNVDRVVKPATSSIMDIVNNDPQFSTLRKLIAESPAIEEQLRLPGQFTLLAPSDEAFTSMEAAAALESGPCIPAILKNHVLPNTICSAAVADPESRTLNMLQKYLKVQLSEDGKIQVDGANIVAKDIVATNGVIHVIDKPLIPTEAKKVLEVLEEQNLTTFIELLKLAEMMQEIELLKDSTIFAPSNEAFAKLEANYLEELKADKARLQSILRHHLTSAPLQNSHMRNNKMVETNSGHSLRMNVYAGPLVVNMFQPVVRRSRITANCAPITLTNARACGAQVHAVDELLIPAENDLITGLTNNPDFSIFTRLVQNSTMLPEFSSETVPLTVLAPSDHVFRTLPKEELDAFFDSPTMQEELVKRHTLREHVCCSGITPSSLFRNLVRTSHGSTLHLRQTHEGFLKAGHARITKCGTQHTNGVLHTVDRLYVEPHVVDGTAQRRWSTDRVQPFTIRMGDVMQLFQ